MISTAFLLYPGFGLVPPYYKAVVKLPFDLKDYMYPARDGKKDVEQHLKSFPFHPDWAGHTSGCRAHLWVDTGTCPMQLLWINDYLNEINKTQNKDPKYKLADGSLNCL